MQKTRLEFSKQPQHRQPVTLLSTGVWDVSQWEARRGNPAAESFLLWQRARLVRHHVVTYKHRFQAIPCFLMTFLAFYMHMPCKHTLGHTHICTRVCPPPKYKEKESKRGLQRDKVLGTQAWCEGRPWNPHRNGKTEWSPPNFPLTWPHRHHMQ